MRIRLVAACGLALLAAAQQAPAAVFNYPSDPLPASLASGDTLNISTVGPFFSFVSSEAGSQVNFLAGGGIFSLTARGDVMFSAMSSGVSSLTLDGGTATASGGVFGQRSDIQNGGRLVVNGGQFIAGARLTGGASAEFRSGQLDGAEIREGSTLSILGPGVVGLVDVGLGQLNLRGGGLAPHPLAPQATILAVHDKLNLFVRSATLGGAPIAGIIPGTPVTIANRGVDLDMVLADGTPFVMPLTSFTGVQTPYAFHDTSIVTVTLIPEPTALATAAVLFGGLARARAQRRVYRRRQG